MKFKMIITCILILMMITINCSCADESLSLNKNSNAGTDRTNKGSTNVNNKETIEIQYFEGESDIEKAIAIFQYNNPEKTALARELVTLANGGEADNFFKPFSSRFVSIYKFMVENSKTNADYDQHIQELISKAGDSYLTGKISEEETLKKIDNEIELFLNE